MNEPTITERRAELEAMLAPVKEPETKKPKDSARIYFKGTTYILATVDSVEQIQDRANGRWFLKTTITQDLGEDTLPKRHEQTRDLLNQLQRETYGV